MQSQDDDAGNADNVDADERRGAKKTDEDTPQDVDGDLLSFLLSAMPLLPSLGSRERSCAT